MSNVALFKGEIPDYLKKVELDDVTKALTGSGGVKRIALGNNRFVLKVNGAEISKTNSDKLEIVVVNVAKDIARTFYATAWTKDGEPTAPNCWSADGNLPDKSIAEPQNSTCMNCPMDIAGSGQGESKACRKERRAAVVLASDLDGDVYQMTFKAMSIFYDSKKPGDLDHMPFNQYGKYVGSQGYNLNSLVTEMRFDEDSTVGKLFFRPVRFLEEHEWEIVKKQGESASAISAITMTVAQTDGIKSLPSSLPTGRKQEFSSEEDEVEEKPTTVAEPVKRVSKKEEPVAPKRDLKAIMGDWATDDE